MIPPTCTDTVILFVCERGQKSSKLLPSVLHECALRTEKLHSSMCVTAKGFSSPLHSLLIGTHASGRGQQLGDETNEPAPPPTHTFNTTPSHTVLPPSFSPSTSFNLTLVLIGTSFKASLSVCNHVNKMFPLFLSYPHAFPMAQFVSNAHNTPGFMACMTYTCTLLHSLDKSDTTIQLGHDAAEFQSKWCRTKTRARAHTSVHTFTNVTGRFM